MPTVECRIMMSSYSIELRSSSGEDVWAASIVYNASISALEVRAFRPEGEPPALLAKIGASPLSLFEVINDVRHHRATINFETATLGFAFECDPAAIDRAGNRVPSGHIVKEVVILRGLRIENK